MNASDSTGVASPEPSPRGVLWVLAVTAAVNLALLAVAWWERSWGALMIATFLGPLMNFILLLSGLLATPWLRRNFTDFSSRRHVASSIAFPVAFTALDAIVILSMDLTGC